MEVVGYSCAEIGSMKVTVGCSGWLVVLCSDRHCGTEHFATHFVWDATHPQIANCTKSLQILYKSKNTSYIFQIILKCVAIEGWWNKNGQENARRNGGCAWRWRHRSKMKRGSWRSTRVLE